MCAFYAFNACLIPNANYLPLAQYAYPHFLFGFRAMNGSAAGLLRGAISPGGLGGGLVAGWGLAAFWAC
jgi:hypothetical protein